MSVTSIIIIVIVMVFPSFSLCTSYPDGPISFQAVIQ